MNGRENDRKSAVNGDLLAKSGYGDGGRRKLCWIKMEQARYEYGKRRGAREAGKKREKWILEKFFRNAIAFVMMFRLVRRVHLACTFREGGNC